MSIVSHTHINVAHIYLHCCKPEGVEISVTVRKEYQTFTTFCLSMFACINSTRGTLLVELKQFSASHPVYLVVYKWVKSAVIQSQRYKYNYIRVSRRIWSSTLSNSHLCLPFRVQFRRHSRWLSTTTFTSINIPELISLRSLNPVNSHRWVDVGLFPSSQVTGRSIRPTGRLTVSLNGDPPTRHPTRLRTVPSYLNTGSPCDEAFISLKSSNFTRPTYVWCSSRNLDKLSPSSFDDRHKVTHTRTYQKRVHVS